jgi:quercetin dioxygenase-like cupin family protein
MSDGQRAVVVAPGDGTTIEGPVGGPLTFKVRGDQTADALTAFENVIPPGEGPPMHVHAREDEAWYVLEGELRFSLGGELAPAAAGSFVFVPRGTPHCFQNVGAAPARILVLFTPSGMERFFERFAELPSGPFDRRPSARPARRRGWTSSGRRSPCPTPPERAAG